MPHAHPEQTILLADRQRVWLFAFFSPNTCCLKLQGDDTAIPTSNLASSLSRIKQTKSIHNVSPTKRGMKLKSSLIVIKITFN
jgi:hypothetical protein